MDLWKELEKVGCPYNDTKNAIVWLDLEIGRLAANIEILERLRDKLEEEERKSDPAYVKVVCPNCNGYCYEYRNELKIKCSMCGGRGYIWAIKVDKDGSS